MADIAELGLRIDSGDVKIANDNLKKFQSEAKGAEVAASRFDREADKASRSAGKLGREAGTASRAFAAMRPALIAAVGALGAFVGASFALRQFVTNTIEAEKVTAQLNAVLASTKGVSGQTIESLNRQATALQKVTTFGDEAIGSAQALLLTFTKIGGSTFPKATAAVLDIATAMGGDLNGAALQLGKALNDPIKGITALTRIGVTFTQAQKDVIKSLVETGDLAGAQAVILRELQTEFGGSAEAARNTLGGALTALSEAWGNLFEVSGSSSDKLRLSIESVIETLQRPEFAQAVNLIGIGLFEALNLAAEGAQKLAFEIDGINSAIERYSNNPGLDNFLAIGGLSLVDGGVADKFRDMINSMTADSKRGAGEIVADMITINQKIIELQNDALGGIFNEIAIDRERQSLKELQDELIGIGTAANVAANAVRADFAQAFREAENASMAALGNIKNAMQNSLPNVTRYGGAENDNRYGQVRNLSGISEKLLGGIDDGTRSTDRVRDSVSGLDRNNSRHFDGLNSTLRGGFSGLGQTINASSLIEAEAILKGMGLSLKNANIRYVNGPNLDLGPDIFGNPREPRRQYSISTGSSGSSGGGVSYGGAFADGGSFIVPGGSRSGDKNLVALHANSGEKVTVERADKTPNVVNLYYNAAPGENERTSRQNARNMWDQLNREAARS